MFKSSFESFYFTNFCILIFMSFSVPFAVIHSTKEDIELQGYRIPKNTMVLPLMFSVFHDPKYWDQPQTFNPDRFLDKSGKIMKKDAQIPFSIGKCKIPFCNYISTFFILSSEL